MFDRADPERPLRPSRADRALAVLALVAAVVEGLLRQGPTVHIAVAAILAGALAYRRTHPLGALAVAFGVTSAATLAQLLSLMDRTILYTNAMVLLFPYALVRWASGKRIAIGLALIACTYVLCLNGEMDGAKDAIGGAIVLLFPAVLGASVRFRRQARRREIENAKVNERALLARELHDTIAHHVSAIAIQAQGGRALLATRPEAASAALATIEEEAARALVELRTLVTALRDDPSAELAPRAALADLEQLARDRPAVAIERVGALDQVAPPVQAVLYRMAQESITNALRHARKPSVIHVRVAAEGDLVRLTVRDDGEHADRRPDGFGLVGMKERAALLGGTLTAGPSEGGGWTVDAVLPRGAR